MFSLPATLCLIAIGWGGVDRISPEAPVPVIQVSKIDDRLGGAGNVARNITSLGGSCTLLGIIGDDDEAKIFRSITRECGIQDKLTVEKNRKTVVKLRIVSANQQLLRADFEELPNASALDEFRERFAEELARHDAVVLSDYGKGTLDLIEPMIKAAIAEGKPVLIDPKGVDFNRYAGATMITPNLNEFRAVAGDAGNEEELNECAAKMLSDYQIEQLLVTMSDKGMRLFDSKRPYFHVDAQSREVFDVSGAGDTVISVMAMAVAAGLDREMGVKIANCAAGAVISKLGTAYVEQDELSRILLQSYPDGLN